MQKHSKPAKSKSTSVSSASKNQGEGDKQSARRFNREEQQFVNSEQGRKAIDKAGQVDASEQQGLVDAEQLGLARTKGDDPAVTRKK